MNLQSFTEKLQTFKSLNLPYKFVLAVDFDKTLCNSHYPDCGEETPICDFIRSIQHLDYIQTLYTCRTGKALEDAILWCKDHNIRIDYANENDPVRIAMYGECRKISYDILIDDRCYNFNINDFGKEGM